MRNPFGKSCATAGLRQVLSLGLLRRVKPGTTTSSPRHTWGGGGHLRASRAGVFFVDPLDEATGASRVPLSLRLVGGTPP